MRKMQTLRVRNTVLSAARARIAVPLVGQSPETILAQARRAVDEGAELLEWRADYAALDAEGTAALLRSLRALAGDVPLLYTLAPTSAGGFFRGTAAEYCALCLAAAHSGEADLVNVVGETPDAAGLVAALHGAGVRAGAAQHDWDGTPPAAELLARLRALAATGADIVKLAVTAHGAQDVDELARAAAAWPEDGAPLILLAMGEAGTITRIDCARFRSVVTFASVGDGSAPGQLPLRELRSRLRGL